MNNSIAFVSILYNPDENALLNIRSAIDAGIKPLVYLNLASELFLEEIRNLDVFILGDNKNVGLGPAFFEIEDFLLVQGFDYFIYFDQDTIVSENVWSSLTSKLYDFKGDESIYEDNTGMLFLTSEPLSQFNKNIVLSSGCLFSLSVIEEIGKHNKVFFVEGVDYEYCLQLNLAGYKIQFISLDGIDHQSLQDSSTFRLFGLSITGRIYQNSRVVDFNKSHSKLIRKSLIDVKFSFLMFFIKSFLAFNVSNLFFLLIRRLSCYFR
jgi:rhamnosyltransferase